MVTNNVEHIKAYVKKQRPDAALRTNGYMFWIESEGKIICPYKITAEKAWRASYEFLQAS